MKKFLLPFLGICLAVLLSFTNSKKIILIDAGHGGEDKGAMVGDLVEKDLTLRISHIIKKLNQDNKDFEIVLLREGDETLSLEQRAKIIEKVNPYLVLSLHLNFNPKNKDLKGKEIYIQSNEKSRVFGEMLGKRFEEGAKVEKKDLKLLKDSKSPALIFEMGYLSNEEDRNLFSNEDGQLHIAKQILEFLKEN